MTQNLHLDPSPFFLKGGPTGVLLIHGFTGSPPEMRMTANYLNQRGCTVSGPLLPGHGTTVEDMNRCRWTDWTARVEQALADLQARCAPVFVGGLSMGSLLTCYLAAHNQNLAGIMLYSPATLLADRRIGLTPLLKHVMSTKPKVAREDIGDPQAALRVWSYDEYPLAAAHQLLKLTRRTRRLMKRVTCPALIIHSTLDPTIHPRSARYTYRRLGSTDKRLITLHESGHTITVDTEWLTVAEATYDFVRQRRGEGAWDRPGAQPAGEGAG